IVRRFFSEKEIAEYSRLPEDIKKKAFFTCWTRKEAFIKAIGMGFYMPLKSFSVSPDPFIKSDVEIHDGPGGRQWFFDDIESEDRDYTACAVTEASGGSISLIFRLYDRQKVL
ncbi:MAG: 4'-phosphopantetheinyl transferase superfamily protein, partial [Brevinematales bacterium]